MEPPTVSVVMCVYNGERYLAEAVESILAQTMRDFEFLIVDDGSTDGTAAILRRYEAADGRVRVSARNHEGLVAALNFGCGLARGRYLARMDADDVALPDRLAKQVAFLDAHPEVAVVGGAIQMITEQGAVVESIVLPQNDPEIKGRLLHENAMAHVTTVMRREVFQAVGGYRAAFAQAEDYDLWLRVADSHELANLPEVVMRCRTRPDSVSVQFRRQQVWSKLGAQLSAEARRATGDDPWDAIQLVTPERLREKGIGARRLQETLLDHYARTANHLARAGRPKEALALLDRARAEAHAEGAGRDLEADLLWTRADIASAGRRYVIAAGSALLAFVLDPSSARRIVRRVRHRVRAL